MTAVTRPRGPLSARVYWTRRLFLLTVVTLLVVGTARVLDTGGDGTDGTAGDWAATAQQAGAEAGAGAGAASESPQPSAAATTTPSVTPSTRSARQRENNQDERRKEKVVLAEPEGTCADSDVLVEPVVDEAVAGDEVVIGLELRTVLTPACTWRVAPETVVVKVTSGDDSIWYSTQCPAAMPTDDVVVRQAQSVRVDLVWSGHRSDEGCAPVQWADPGWYHVGAAALGSEPADVQFELEEPVGDLITKFAQPKKKQPEKKQPGKKPSERPGDR